MGLAYLRALEQETPEGGQIAWPIGFNVPFSIAGSPLERKRLLIAAGIRLSASEAMASSQGAPFLGPRVRLPEEARGSRVAGELRMQL